MQATELNSYTFLMNCCGIGAVRMDPPVYSKVVSTGWLAGQPTRQRSQRFDGSQLPGSQRQHNERSVCVQRNLQGNIKLNLSDEGINI